MKYYLNCDDENKYREILSTLNYYGFNIKSNAKYIHSADNIFIADTSTLDVEFSHSIRELKISKKDFTSIKDFEDAYLSELSTVY